MGFGQGLSGLNAAAQELDVIGNNIANAGTVGFKSSSVVFSDVYANSQVGLGVKLAAVNQRFTVGSITNTGNELDLAIDGMKGLFRVEDTNGNVLYTRNGQFFADDKNFIVNAQGQRLTGFGLIGDDMAPLQVPLGNLPPSATTDIATMTNLNANANIVYTEGDTIGLVYSDYEGAGFQQYRYRLDSATGELLSWTNADGSAAAAGKPTDVGGPHTFSSAADGSSPVDVAFDASGNVVLAEVANFKSVGETDGIVARPFSTTDANSYTHSLPLTVYDSLGNSNQFIQYFVKRESVGGETAWDVYYAMDGNVTNAASPHQMRFSESGQLVSGQQSTLTITNVGGLAAPAADLELVFDYDKSTSFSGAFSYTFTPSGYPTGEYAGISIGTDGAVIASYTNGEMRTTGYVALANFNNLNGLKPSGDNAWVETGASGQPIVGRPGTNGLASIKGQAVEESNVDMSQELVRMIIAQRFYQANAQTIKTQDQIVQTLISMR